MKAIVVTDSHGDYRNFSKIISKHVNEVDYIIHLGDGEADLDELNINIPSLTHNVIYIGGNCDLGLHKRTEIFVFNGIRIFLSLGDYYKIKTDKTLLAGVAKNNKCSAAFFGHSHLPFCDTIDGFTLLNPGSYCIQADGCKPSYAIVESDNGQFIIDILDI